MLLKDLINLIDDESILCVNESDKQGNISIVATHVTKDNIPKFYLFYSVWHISHKEDGLYIWVEY